MSKSNRRIIRNCLVVAAGAMIALILFGAVAVFVAIWSNSDRWANTAAAFFIGMIGSSAAGITISWMNDEL